MAIAVDGIQKSEFEDQINIGYCNFLVLQTVSRRQLHLHGYIVSQRKPSSTHDAPGRRGGRFMEAYREGKLDRLGLLRSENYVFLSFRWRTGGHYIYGSSSFDDGKKG